MDSIRDRVVTLASLRRPPTQSEAAESLPEAQTPEAQLKQAQYDQIMQRLQQAADDVGSDVMITVQDREVSLAQSKIAEQATATRPLASGGQEVQFGTGLSGGDWLRWMWSLTDWVDRKEAHPIRPPDVPPRPTCSTGDLTVAMAADWGTGLYGAPKIAEAMRTMRRPRKFDLLMHLGDVYYSGTKPEIEGALPRSLADRRRHAEPGAERQPRDVFRRLRLLSTDPARVQPAAAPTSRCRTSTGCSSASTPPTSTTTWTPRRWRG